MSGVLFARHLVLIFVHTTYQVTVNFNPLHLKSEYSDLMDFTLSNARRFYSSKGDLLGLKGLK